MISKKEKKILNKSDLFNLDSLRTKNVHKQRERKLEILFYLPILQMIVQTDWFAFQM